MPKSRLCRAALIGFLLFCAGGLEAGEQWLTSLDEARRLAATERKELFIVFTGTSWCGPCVDFEKDVLSRPEFLDRTGRFVLVKLEYPKTQEELPEAQREPYIAWQEQYGVYAFPTVFLADATGRPYAMTGSIGLGPLEFAQHVEQYRLAGEARDAALSKAMGAQGIEKARRLDAALSALAAETGQAERRVDMLVRFYRPEIDQILDLDKTNAVGLRDKYLGMLGDQEEQTRLAAMEVRFKVAMKEGGAAAALKLIDEELGQAKTVEVRKRLQNARRTHLEWGERYEEALAYSNQLLKDDLFSAEEKRGIRGRIAYDLKQLDRIDESAAVYDGLIAEVAADRDAEWRFLRDKAVMLTGAKRNADALETWDRSRRYVEEGSDHWLDSEVFRCRLLGKLGRIDEASSAFDAALKSKALKTLDRANLLSEKAMVLGKAGRRDEAVSCAAQAEEVLGRTKTDGESEDVSKFIKQKLSIARGDQKKGQ
ncbi:thioredoxin family protein [Paludisphaera borealis]|uniref:Disulfide bond reductase DsbH n=1 Tax=Paludisphaera borealis TaxID=1387353 RepID=A0A1U7CLX6_9BACT|nr:thioredoxin family protein [Paludisphaera borealis]APW59940.1 Disulfide bond reductase DsbH [Paludisphaera borealis]